MLIESRELGRGQEVRGDVCVIGAGPAGITLAIELARRGREVIVAESGGLAPDSRTQLLGDADGIDEQRHSLMNIGTQRAWGGTSTIWGGRCVPLDEVDFEERRSRNRAIWPISHAELSTYLADACKYALCGAPAFSVRSAFGVSAPAIVAGFVDGDVTASLLERWSPPIDFGATYAAEARAADRLRVYLGFTCLGFTFGASLEHVEGVHARSLGGKLLTIKARYIVVAAGGLASTRLLMDCDAAQPGGVGNHSGLLGRYYMGHISGKIADVQFTTPPRETIFGFERDAQGIYCRRRFVVSATLQRKRGLLNCALWLDNPPLADAAHRNGILSFAYFALSTPVLSRCLAPEAIRQAAIEHPRRSSLSSHLYNILRDLPATSAFMLPFLYRRYFAKRKIPGFFLFNRANRYAIHYHGEQGPNPESRVSLTDARDELGMRRLSIDLRYSAGDIESIIKTHEVLDGWLRRLGIGRLEYREPDLAAAIDRQAKDGIHQLGTTRMSMRPEDGVVDANCRVHSVDNLYVLSSSVFPTSGQANPTLTVIALAIRLAEHLATAARQGIDHAKNRMAGTRT